MGFFSDMFHAIEHFPENFVDDARAGMKATDHLNESTHGFSYAIPFYGVARGLMDSVVTTDNVSKGKIGAGEFFKHMFEDDAQMIFSGIGSTMGIAEGAGALYGSTRVANTMLNAGSRVSANTGRVIRNLPARGSRVLDDVRYSIRTRNLPREGLNTDMAQQTRLARTNERVLQRGSRPLQTETQRISQPVRTAPRDPQASLRTGTGQAKIARPEKLSSRLLRENPNVFKPFSGKIPEASSDLQRVGMRGSLGLDTPVIESRAGGLYMGNSLVG
jgi:hypothetical protein